MMIALKNLLDVWIQILTLALSVLKAFSAAVRSALVLMYRHMYSNNLPTVIYDTHRALSAAFVVPWTVKQVDQNGQMFTAFAAPSKLKKVLWAGVCLIFIQTRMLYWLALPLLGKIKLRPLGKKFEENSAMDMVLYVVAVPSMLLMTVTLLTFVLKVEQVMASYNAMTSLQRRRRRQLWVTCTLRWLSPQIPIARLAFSLFIVYPALGLATVLYLTSRHSKCAFTQWAFLVA